MNENYSNFESHDNEMPTAEEAQCMYMLMQSPRASMIIKTLIHSYAKKSLRHAADLTGFCANLSEVIMQHAYDTASMVQFGQMALEHAVHDKKQGSVSPFDVIAYVINFANFKRIYEDSINMPGRKRMVMATELMQNNPAADMFISRYVKMLDDPDSYSDLWETALPGFQDMMQWCRDNRDKWDDTVHEESK